MFFFYDVSLIYAKRPLILFGVFYPAVNRDYLSHNLLVLARKERQQSFQQSQLPFVHTWFVLPESIHYANTASVPRYRVYRISQRQKKHVVFYRSFANSEFVCEIPARLATPRTQRSKYSPPSFRSIHYVLL